MEAMMDEIAVAMMEVRGIDVEVVFTAILVTASVMLGDSNMLTRELQHIADIGEDQVLITAKKIGRGLKLVYDEIGEEFPFTEWLENGDH